MPFKFFFYNLKVARIQVSPKVRMRKRIAHRKTTHHGWECDGCKKTPIEGTIYIQGVSSCRCEKCYIENPPDDESAFNVCRTEGESLEVAFKEIDADHSGGISRKEFHNYMTTMGAPKTMIGCFFDGIDLDSDNMINFDEFKALFVSEPLPAGKWRSRSGSMISSKAEYIMKAEEEDVKNPERIANRRMRRSGSGKMVAESTARPRRPSGRLKAKLAASGASTGDAEAGEGDADAPKISAPKILSISAAEGDWSFKKKAPKKRRLSGRRSSSGVLSQLVAGNRSKSGTLLVAAAAVLGDMGDKEVEPAETPAAPSELPEPLAPGALAPDALDEVLGITPKISALVV